MDPQVSHRAHHRDILIKKPGVLSWINTPRFRSAMTKGCPESYDLTDLTITDQFACLFVCLGEALILTNHQNLAGFVCGIYHSLAILERGRHWFLAKNMLARL